MAHEYENDLLSEYERGAYENYFLLFIDHEHIPQCLLARSHTDSSNYDDDDPEIFP